METTELTKHEFALQYHAVQTLYVGKELAITEKELVHRIAQVLRCSIGQVLMLFDQQHHAHITITAISKKDIKAIVQWVHSNIVHDPLVTVLLPLLKRDAYEQALYAATELGANAVQLVITKKVHRAWMGNKEMERSQHILIAAAEQSKNFAYPVLHEPQELSPVVASLQRPAYKLFFDPQGNALDSVIHDIRIQKPSHIVLMVGPEGDLIEEEKELLRKNNFVFTALTPTVLRAQQALVVGLGCIRTLVK